MTCELHCFYRDKSVQCNEPRINNRINRVGLRMKRNSPKSCMDQYYNNSRVIFPGRYTVANPLDSHVCVESLKQCGDVFDFCENYISNNLYDRYWNPNKTQGGIFGRFLTRF